MTTPARFLRIPEEAQFTSRVRDPRLTSRVGVLLGLSLGTCFVTGLISHWAQLPLPKVPFPTSPSWGYRVSQGVHVASGTAAVPLLLVKLWSVYPRLFRRPARGLSGAAVTVAERLSVALLVSAAIFELATGLANVAHWYPWPFSFRRTHYAVAWLLIGALLIHVAIHLPVIRSSLAKGIAEPEGSDGQDLVEPGAAEAGVSRRSLLRATQTAAAVAVVATVGQTVPQLRELSVLAPRSGRGPGGVPINKTAVAAGVIGLADAPDYRLEVSVDGRVESFSLADLRAMKQRSDSLPIACVEGWSAVGRWGGVPLATLLASVGATREDHVTVHSLQPRGPFRTTTLPANFAWDPRTLLALDLAGAPLSLDHGYPCRLVAPNRPGVLQTKWVARLEVSPP
ncbi:MAG: molybdopterin-dependent oxidoreductase [Nocardioides sp.]